jgi:hypothetical protein
MDGQMRKMNMTEDRRKEGEWNVREMGRMEENVACISMDCNGIDKLKLRRLDYVTWITVDQ